MKTNTKELIQLVTALNNNDVKNEHVTIEKLIRDLREFNFSIDDEIIINQTTKKMKPAYFKNLYSSLNNGFYVVYCRKEKNYNINVIYYFNGVKFEKMYGSCFNWIYDSEPQYRNKAEYTIIIYQDNKYYEKIAEKIKKRAALKTNDDRFILKKDRCIETCSDPELQQRYKYIHFGYDSKKYDSELESNLYKSNIYKFKLYIGYGRNKEIEIDKSGYILTYRREKLAEKVKEIKKNKAIQDFNNLKLDYLNKLENSKNKIENFILKISKKAIESNFFNNLNICNQFYDFYLKDIRKDIIYFIAKIESNNINNIFGFVEDLNKLIINDDYISNKLKDFNIYLNFKKLFDGIEKELKYEFYSFLEKNNIKWISSKNVYGENKHKIEDEKIFFLGYSKPIENYFDFVEE